MLENKAYKKLLVWSKSDELAHQIYQVTKKFPNEEIYGLTSQIRRSALSIPTNIVEGCGRQGKKEIKQFINIALGSLFETEYLLEFSFKLKYISESDFLKIEALRTEVGKLLWGFYQSL